MDNLKTGLFIKQRRKAKGLTQKDVADKLNITDRAVSKWERGLSAPDISLLIPLAELLGVTVTRIINGENRQRQTVDNTLKDIIDYSEKEIGRKTTRFKRRFVLWAVGVFFCLWAAWVTLNSFLFGDGFGWQCIPANICAQNAATALESYNRQGIEKYIGGSENMHGRLMDLYDRDVVILQAKAKPGRTRLDDMFLRLEIDLIVRSGDIKYRFTCNGTYRSGKVELMHIAAEDAEKDYPRWMTELSDVLATYNPG